MCMSHCFLWVGFAALIPWTFYSVYINENKGKKDVEAF